MVKELFRLHRDTLRKHRGPRKNLNTQEKQRDGRTLDF